jgi:transcription initiation factor TFIID subunit 11
VRKGGSERADDDVPGGTDEDKEREVVEEEEEEEEVVADGEEFERRRELQEEIRVSDREKMVELLKHFTPEQMNRYECYRRSSLPKPVLKRLFQTITGTILNPNGLIVLAAVGKLFVGELIEMARQVADEHGVSDLDEIKPTHVREAHRRMEAEGKMFRERKKVLFRNRRL